MFDYRGIEALYTVQELQSFEEAAKKLHITQSAVSQRIKGLETHYGEPVLIRTLPYRPTQLGEYLIAHFKRICVLEETLERQISSSSMKPRISIAINRDSLETWFLELIDQKSIFGSIVVEVIADDQELTIDYFKKGLVGACLSTFEKEVMGGQVAFLGHMEYLLVSSPAFAKQYFKKKTDIKQGLLHAPAIKFDKNDRLHERYLEKYFGINGGELNYQMIPSLRGFKKYALLGYGYGLIPRIDIVDELKKKRLVLLTDKAWKIPLYWHYWRIESDFYQKFQKDVIQYVRKKLDEKTG